MGRRVAFRLGRTTHRLVTLKGARWSVYTDRTTPTGRHWRRRGLEGSWESVADNNVVDNAACSRHMFENSAVVVGLLLGEWKLIVVSTLTIGWLIQFYRIEGNQIWHKTLRNTYQSKKLCILSPFKFFWQCILDYNKYEFAAQIKIYN